MNKLLPCLAFACLSAAGCRDLVLEKKLQALQPRYAGDNDLVFSIIDNDRISDLVALVKVAEVDSTAKAYENGHPAGWGWTCSKFEIEEVLSGDEPSPFIYVSCSYTLIHPDLILGIMSDRGMKDPRIKARPGDRLLLCLKRSQDMNHPPEQPGYDARAIYRMKNEGEALPPIQTVLAAIRAAKKQEQTGEVYLYVNPSALSTNLDAPNNGRQILSLLRSVPDEGVFFRPLHTETENLASVAMYGSMELSFELTGQSTPDGVVYSITKIENGN